MNKKDYISILPEKIIQKITRYLPPPDTRNLAYTNTLLKNVLDKIMGILKENIYLEIQNLKRLVGSPSTSLKEEVTLLQSILDKVHRYQQYKEFPFMGEENQKKELENLYSAIYRKLWFPCEDLNDIETRYEQIETLNCMLIAINDDISMTESMWIRPIFKEGTLESTTIPFLPDYDVSPGGFAYCKLENITLKDFELESEDSHFFQNAILNNIQQEGCQISHVNLSSIQDGNIISNLESIINPEELNSHSILSDMQNAYSEQQNYFRENKKILIKERTKLLKENNSLSAEVSRQKEIIDQLQNKSKLLERSFLKKAASTCTQENISIEEGEVPPTKKLCLK